MATVHLICGFLGAGKSTFAADVARRANAVRFSVDELYLSLFADGPTYELDQAKLDRLFATLDRLWPQVVRAGTDVVLDFGFWSGASRRAIRERAGSIGGTTRLYWVRCSDATALARCLERNGREGSFLISEEGYRELKAKFEKPAEDENFEVVETEPARREEPCGADTGCYTDDCSNYCALPFGHAGEHLCEGRLRTRRGGDDQHA